MASPAWQSAPEAQQNQPAWAAAPEANAPSKANADTQEKSFPGTLANAASHAGERLSEIPGAFGGMVMHPINTAENIYQQGKQLAGEGVDAAKAGDYPLAAARGIETMMPGIGPAIANGFRTIKSGDTSGGIGDMVGTVGPALVGNELIRSPYAEAALKGGLKAATAPARFHGIDVPGGSTMAGAAAGHVVGGTPGSIVGGSLPFIRGAVKGVRELRNGVSPEPTAPVAPPPVTFRPSESTPAGTTMSPPPVTFRSPEAGPIQKTVAPPPVTFRDAGAAQGTVAPPPITFRNQAEPPATQRVYPAPPVRFRPDSGSAPAVPSVAPQPVAVEEAPAATPVVSAPEPQATPIHSEITKQYQPSRTRARFDASGKRTGG